jgi:hypothetical protein
MHPGIPLAYAARHIYTPNQDPYRTVQARGSSKQRRRRRRSAAELFVRRPRTALFHRHAASGR